ncbi:MAG TPA: hypothetical protein VF753_21090 [Terriglobales bacterium]
MPKKKSSAAPKPASNLTDSEMDLLSHMEQGYQLETNSLGSEPLLRHLKDNEVIRAASANRSTVQSLEKRGLIAPGKSRDPLTIVWQLTQKKK